MGRRRAGGEEIRKHEEVYLSELKIREKLHTNSLQFSLLEQSLFLKLLLNINQAQTSPRETDLGGMASWLARSVGPLVWRG